MDCQDVTDRLAAWLDGELGPSESTLLEAHLDGCSECNALARRLADQSLTAREHLLALTGAPQPLDDSFWEPMMGRLKAEMKVHAHRRDLAGRRRYEVRVGPGGAVAYCALLLAALAWGLWNHRRAEAAREAAAAATRRAEQQQRLAAQPEPPSQVHRVDLVKYTPMRGTF